jgi:hypothetical protein
MMVERRMGIEEEGVVALWQPTAKKPFGHRFDCARHSLDGFQRIAPSRSGAQTDSSRSFGWGLILVAKCPVITRTQLAAACKTLEVKLQELGFVFLDVQFDEAAETLCIVLDNEPSRRSQCLTQQDPTNAATIDARLLRNVLRELIKLGAMSPAIQLKGQRVQPKTLQAFECHDSRTVK